MSLDQDKVRFIKGEDNQFVIVTLTDEETKTLFDFTSITAVTAIFVNSDGTCLEITGDGSTSPIEVVSPAQGGQLKITLSAAQILDLRVSKNQDFDVKITKSGRTRIARFRGKLDVLDTLC